MRCRPALTAAFAVVVLVVGQLVALVHAASTRHVECAEHGEQLEAVSLAGADDGCMQSHFIGVEGDGGGDHEDCELVRALHQSSDTPPQAPTSFLLVLAAAAPAVVLPLASATSELYRIAPKTSPPVAG
jgi:hypothetical protein